MLRTSSRFRSGGDDLSRLPHDVCNGAQRAPNADYSWVEERMGAYLAERLTWSDDLGVGCSTGWPWITFLRCLFGSPVEGTPYPSSETHGSCLAHRGPVSGVVARESLRSGARVFSMGPVMQFRERDGLQSFFLNFEDCSMASRFANASFRHVDQKNRTIRHVFRTRLAIHSGSGMAVSSAKASTMTCVISRLASSLAMLLLNLA